MTEQQYKQEKEALIELHEDALVELAKRYALANNTVKIDDIVTDHIGSIQVKRIKVNVYDKPPVCMYFGIELRKDGTPMKKQENRGIWQCNLIKK